MIVWHSAYLDSTWNTAGVTDSAVDYFTEQIAASQEDGARLLALGRAFDRILTWNHYIIPEWYSANFRLAYQNKFEKPATHAKYDYGLDTWWVK
jgi:microcin C transport system substrate-binding protein